MNSLIPESFLWLQAVLNFVIFTFGTLIILHYFFGGPLGAERILLLLLLEGMCLSKGYVAYELIVLPNYEGPQEFAFYLLLNSQMALCAAGWIVVRLARGGNIL